MFREGEAAGKKKEKIIFPNQSGPVLFTFLSEAGVHQVVVTDDDG